MKSVTRSWRKKITWPLMFGISSAIFMALVLVNELAVQGIQQSELTPIQALTLRYFTPGILFLWLVMISAISKHFNEMDSRLSEQEDRLAKAGEKALIDSQLKSDLLARVDHDLRQPLGVILGFSEMMRDEVWGPLNNQQQRAITEMISSTNYLSGMVSDLLDTARLEAHNLHLRIDDFSPALLLRQVTGQVMPLAERKGLGLASELDPRLPETLRGDPGRLLQILSHLAGNAVSFTRQGSVRIRAFCAGEGHWALSVADTGCGIPLDARETIFEPFYQGNDPASRDRGSVGLGLAIVQQLVHLMGGTIRVESTVGVGSTFLVTLPLDPNLNRKEVNSCGS